MITYMCKSCLVLLFLYLIWRLNLVDKDRQQVHPRVTESKHHAYTTNTTLTQELQGLKYSKGSQKPEEHYKQDAYLN
jgi:hypothetical protein